MVEVLDTVEIVRETEAPGGMVLDRWMPLLYI